MDITCRSEGEDITSSDIQGSSMFPSLAGQSSCTPEDLTTAGMNSPPEDDTDTLSLALYTVHTLQARLSERSNELDKCQTELRACRAREASTIAKAKQLKSALDTATARTDSLDRQVKTLASDLAEARATAAAAASQKWAGTASMEGVRDELASREARLERERTRNTQLAEQVAELRAELGTVTARGTDAARDRDAAASRAEQAEALLAARTAELAQARSATESWSVEKQALETRVQVAAEQLQAAETRSRAAREEAETARKEVHDATQRATAAETARTMAAQVADDAREVARAAQRDLEAQAARTEAAQQRAIELEELLQSAGQSVSKNYGAMQQALAAKNAAIAQLNADVAGLRADLAGMHDLQAQRNSAIKALREAQAATDAAEAEAKNAKSVASAAEARMKSLVARAAQTRELMEIIKRQSQSSQSRAAGDIAAARAAMESAQDQAKLQSETLQSTRQALAGTRAELQACKRDVQALHLALEDARQRIVAERNASRAAKERLADATDGATQEPAEPAHALDTVTQQLLRQAADELAWWQASFGAQAQEPKLRSAASPRPSAAAVTDITTAASTSSAASTAVAETPVRAPQAPEPSPADGSVPRAPQPRPASFPPLSPGAPSGLAGDAGSCLSARSRHTASSSLDEADAALAAAQSRLDIIRASRQSLSDME